jgi:hypothetical protein
MTYVVHDVIINSKTDTDLSPVIVPSGEFNFLFEKAPQKVVPLFW